MTHEKTTLKILWAIDPIDPAPALIAHARDFLRGIIERTSRSGTSDQLAITPAHVLTDIPDHWRAPTDQAADEEPIELARRAVEQIVTPMGFPASTFQRVEVLLLPGNGLRPAARKLAEYAGIHGYDCIVATSHGRRGLERITLGSFAEELILTSSIPVLIIGKRNAPSATEDYKEVLFATDLSAASRKAFSRFLPFARVLGSVIRLYHAMGVPNEMLVAAGMSGGLIPTGATLPSEAVLDSEKWETLRLLEEWRNYAIENGVPCTYELDPEAGRLAERIMEAATRTKASLVALAGLSGRMTSVIFGSVAREVVRESNCPAWILHEPMTRP
jgi:nucleotide-binding universal stress UspA family protein